MKSEDPFIVLRRPTDERLPAGKGRDDKGEAKRIDQAEARIDHVETRIDHAELRIDCAEMMIDQDATQTQRAAAHTEQAATTVEQAGTRPEQTETRTKDAETQTERAEARTDEANTRTDQANTRTEQANIRTEQAEARSAQAILASELRYRRLFETAQDGILILDAETGQVVDANPFMKDLLGYSQEEFLGRKLWEIGPFKGTTASKIAFAELQLKDRIRYEGLPLETKDGQRVEVEFISNAYLVDKKRLIQCNIRDITERKLAEMASIRLAAIIESSNDAIIGKDLNSIVTSWNQGAEKIFGYTAGEMVGTSILRLIPSDRQDEENQILEKIKSGEIILPFETLRQTKEGKLIDVSVAVSPIKDITGAVVGVSKVARDITEHKRTEDQLKISFKEVADLKAAVDEHAIVAITDPQGKITYVNDKFCAASKYSREELLGQDHSFINSSFHPKEFICDLWTTITAGKVWKGEIKNKAKDGSFYWVDTTIVPFLNDDGTPRQYVAIRTNITARKAVEEKISRLNAELEQRVAERTAQLQDANKELQAFSYSVSHDLRAPLRHVLGFVDLLQKEAGPSLSEKSLRHLTTISQSAKRMGNLIDDLLAFSQIGQSVIKKVEVHLDKLVRETVHDFLAETKERNIVWEIDPLPKVWADRDLLRMVLVNLISNAVKFTGHRAEAKIAIGCAPNGDDETVIFIRDNGAGFDPKYIGKLFGVFQRLHNQDQFEGTGIGLANVQRIIHRHGGRVWAEGVVEGGATFNFSIPKQMES